MWCMRRFQLHSIRIPPESGNEAIMLQDDGCRVADCQDLFFPVCGMDNKGPHSYQALTMKRNQGGILARLLMV